MSQKIFPCPEDGCSREFRYATSLDHHLLLGNCDYKEEKLSLPDKSKLKYAQKLEQENTLAVSLTEHQDDRSRKSSLKIGWGLKVKKAKTAFTEDQKLYLHEKFNVGKQTGHKEDPVKVAEDMRSSVKNGERRFKKEHFLTPQQISSFFSRLSQKDRKDTDYVAALADRYSDDKKRKVLEKLAM